MDKIFVNGMVFRRSPKAPDFVLGTVSIKVNEFIEFLKLNQKGDWVNIDVKKSKKTGKPYCQLNTYERKS